jgi:5-methylcytosine-specific restriction endonuclease McrA
MNYKKVYDSIVSRAKDRFLSEYTERHHIIPRCMGGGDESENIVSLTAREHFVCHWLLARQYPNNLKLLHAFTAMTFLKTSTQFRYTPSSRAVSEAKEYASIIKKARPTKRGHRKSEETKQKMRLSKLGDKNPMKRPEVVEKNRLAHLGKKQSEETKDKRRKKLKGRKRPQEVVDKIKAGLTGKKLSKSHVESLKGPRNPYGSQVIVKCRYCGKTGGKNAITRWHNENCKYK